MSELDEKLSAFHKGQILTEGLILVREDICDWITTLFQCNIIRGETFLDSLNTGVLLCDLLQRIYQHVSPKRLPSHWPKKPPNADRRATPLSFKARDNVSLFLEWCRAAGLRNTILFETKGLMNNDEEKNVVLTLLHLGEICVDFDIPVPQFARFKREIDVAQMNKGRNNSVCLFVDVNDAGSIDSGFNSARSTLCVDSVDNGSTKKKTASRRPSATKAVPDKILDVMQTRSKCQSQKSVPRNTIRALKNTTVNTATNKPRQTRSKSIGSLCTDRDSCNDSVVEQGVNTLDGKVREISKRCCCETKFQIERTTMHEGMYRIGTKNIFVRMFKDNVMLRIGGGWETLNEYLDKVDPCCKTVSRRKSMSNILSSSSSSERVSAKDLRNGSQTELTKVTSTHRK